MLGGLYGDLPPPSSADEDDKPTNSTVWSSSTKMAPQTLRKPASIFSPPQTILKSHAKPKPAISKAAAASPVAAPVMHSNAVQPAALVGVTSTVLKEYDPARPNDYEEYRRERKKKAMEAEVRRELDRRRVEEEEEKERREREDRERERERVRDFGDSRLNISGEEAWRRRAVMSGAAIAPRSPSPPSNADGFSIGKSESGGLGVGAGGQMTAAQRMMAKMGWKQGQGLGKRSRGLLLR